jgi:hypothetical protein
MKRNHGLKVKDKEKAKEKGKEKTPASKDDSIFSTNAELSGRTRCHCLATIGYR